jgi:GT2 family glycosyltransferase
MVSAGSVSVIIPTFHREGHLACALESWARQTHHNYEVIVVDDGCSFDTRPLVGRFAPRMNVRVISKDTRGRATARNRGVRAADGDRVVITDESRIVGADFLERVCSTDDDVVVGRRGAIISTWEPHLPGATSARLASMIRARPDLGGVLGARPRVLFDAEVLGRDFETTVQSFAVEDYLWDLTAPIVSHFGAGLEHFHLRWLTGLIGGLAVPRRALFEIGLLDEQASEWDLEDPDLTYRLERHGLKLRLDPHAWGLVQQRPFSSWPKCGLRNITRFAAKHDPIDAWLLCRFLTKEDPIELDGIAADRRSSPVANELHCVVKELVPRLIEQLEVWWRT